jgi:hypothetical protein
VRARLRRRVGAGAARRAHPRAGKRSEAERGERRQKELMLADPRGIWFTTPHWDGYKAVLMHIPDLKQLKKAELRSILEDAWLATS